MKVVGSFQTLTKTFYILEELDKYGEPCGYYIVSKEGWEQLKDLEDSDLRFRLFKQRIEKVINSTIFLSGGKIIKYVLIDDNAKEVLNKLRQTTENGLLEQAIALAEGSDTPEANEVFRNIKEVLYYAEYTKEGNAGGLIGGLGFPGDAWGVMIAVTEHNEPVVIVEEVVSYVEGYAVERYKVPLEVIKIIRSRKFGKEALKILKDLKKRR